MKKHTFVVLAYKESDKLEECIQSVLNQSIKTSVVLATSTPNDFINKIAKKYKLEVIVNKNPNGIAGDFNFATSCVKSCLVTIAHQDDIYDFTYAENILTKYKKCPNSLILFTDYYEIKNDKKEYSNTNLKIKRILLLPLRISGLSKYKFIKRWSIRWGNAICCPAVTFVQKNIPKDPFLCSFKCNVDWYAWENLSKLKGNFSYIPKKIMGHRIHEESTTTNIIKDHIRTKEDLEMFKKFWPDFIAKIINRMYSQSEKNNNV